MGFVEVVLVLATVVELVCFVAVHYMHPKELVMVDDWHWQPILLDRYEYCCENHLLRTACCREKVVHRLDGHVQRTES